MEHILTLVARIFRVQCVLVCLCAHERVYIRNARGFAAGDFPWRWGFCGWGIATPNPEVLVIEDAREDARRAFDKALHDTAADVDSPGEQSAGSCRQLLTPAAPGQQPASTRWPQHASRGALRPACRMRKNRNMVDKEGGMRFFGGVPLIGSSGHRLGMLIIIDQEPRRVSADQMAILVNMSGEATPAATSQSLLTEALLTKHLFPQGSRGAFGGQGPCC